MTNEDVVLSVGVEDTLAPALAKMTAQVRAFGQAVGAESKDIERTSRRISTAMADLGAAGKPVANLGTQVSRSMQIAQAGIARYQKQLDSLNLRQNKAGQWINAGTGQFASGAQIAEYNKARAAIDMYSGALARAQGRQQAASATFAEAIGPVDRSRATMQRLYESMWGVSGATDRTTRSFRGLGDVLNASPSLRYSLYDVSSTLGILGAGFLAAGSAAVVTAARWESAFATVSRTTDGTDEELGRIYDSLVNLSTEVPVAFGELAEIASVGAQMGIAADAVVNYTETIAKLTATTNLTADSAGQALGRFASLFSEVDAGSQSMAVTSDTFDNLGSAILKVGVNSIATESGIVSVATQLSSMAAWAGYTADQTVGLAGAMSSLGVPPELSRGVITRIFTEMGEAVSQGGLQLDNFASIAGVSASEFAAAFGTERFAPVFTAFIRGLSEMSANGGDAVAALHNLGITSVRDVPVLQRLAGAVSQINPEMLLLEQTMADANSGMMAGTEINIQYAKIAQTVSARTQVLLNTFERLFATMGEGTLGPVSNLIAFVTQLTSGFTELISTDVGATMATWGVGIGVLVGAILLLGSGLTRATAGMVAIGNAFVQLSGKAELSARAIRGVNLAMAGLGAIGAALAVVTFFSSLAAGADAALKPISDTTGLMNALREDTAKSGAAFKIYENGAAGASAESERLKKQSELMAEALDNGTSSSQSMADGVEDVGDAAQRSAVKFGSATRDFIADSIAQSEAFQNLFKVKTDAFGPGFAEGSIDPLIEGGFNVQELVQRMAEGGRESAAAYLEGITGVKANEDWLDDMRWWGTRQQEDLAQIQGELLDMAENGELSAEQMARLGVTTREAGLEGASGLAAIPEELEQAASASADLAEKVGAALAKFAETGSLIDLTQKMVEFNRQAEAGEITWDEAAAGFETAWTEAYGGASFSMQEYLTVFRRAAEEQARQVDGLNQLKWRGVPDDILNDLAAMGPESARLVQALVDSTDAELQEYVDLYGQTGFDAMVALAAQQQAASTIVKNAAAALGDEAFMEFSNALGSGTPLADALKQWNLDAQGVPLGPYTGEVELDDSQAELTFLEINGSLLKWDSSTGTATLNAGSGNIPKTFQDANGRLWAWDKATGTARLMANKDPAESAIGAARAKVIQFGNMSTTATLNARLTGTIDWSYWNAINTYQNYKNVAAGGHLAFRGMATGGYTGDGGKYEPKAIVHGGEFVFTKEATKRIGVDNLYAMMHGAQRGAVASRSGGGYAAGGEVTSMGPAGQIMSFGPLAFQQLRAALQSIVSLDGRVISDNVMDHNSFDNTIGRG